MMMIIMLCGWCTEPNLLSHTAHSISRKGVKKRDLSDVELRDILSDVLPHIHTDHVLPKDSEVLTSAIKRGLISIPPSHMIGSDSVAVGGQSSASAWVRTRNMTLFIRPRLFVPYFDEVKVRIVLYCTYYSAAFNSGLLFNHLIVYSIFLIRLFLLSCYYLQSVLV